jgi:hypothetical protein
MLWAQLALTLASLAVCCFAPGFALVRRLPWRPLEKLCGAAAASLILVYLVAWAVFCFAPGSETGAFRAAACVAAGLAIWQWRDFRKLAQSFGARQALLGYAFLLVWSLPALAMIRNFSGAGWGGDWLEHFQRSLFFLHHLPTDIEITGGYLLPARPPFMNLLGAFFLGQIADRFEIFQLVFTFLNLLAFLPCCLLLRALVKNRKSRYLPLTALFALNPMMMENSWYPWTKLLAVFFVLFALWLYLAGLRKSDSLRIVAAFICLAAGLLVHYSAGPYVIFLAGHYLFRVFLKRPNRVRELASIGISCGLLLATWFGWSLKAYGAHDTFESNTSVAASQKYQGSTAGKIAGNVVATVIPAILHNPESLSMFNQPNKWGELRDNFFVLYQTNLIFAMGLIGGPFVIWLLYRSFRNPKGRRAERNFWIAFIPFTIVIGIAVVGEPDLMGLAHLTLMPLEALGITLIAASFPWSRAAAFFLVVGCLLDFSLGIALHARVQSFENTPQRTIFEGFSIQNNRVLTGGQGPDSLGGAAWLNWFWKNRDNLHRQWIGKLGGVNQTPSVQRFAKEMLVEIGKNSRNFGGWYGRHGGHVTLLGDDLAGPSLAGLDVPSLMMLFLFLALMRAFWMESMRFAPLAAYQLPSGPPASAAKKKLSARKR